MIVIMESLNNAAKKNMLDSNKAIKCLTDIKVCDHINFQSKLYKNWHGN